MRHARRLARIPLLIVVHSECDTLSPFLGSRAIVDRIYEERGHAQLMQVPNELADSDPGGKKRIKNGHN